MQQAIDQSGGIDGQSHFGLKALFVIQLILINVANDLPCVTGKSLKVVARYDIVQSRAYRDKEIAILHCKVRCPCSHNSRPPNIQRMIMRQQIEGIPCKDRGNIELLNKCSKTFGSTGEANAMSN